MMNAATIGKNLDAVMKILNVTKDLCAAAQIWAENDIICLACCGVPAPHICPSSFPSLIKILPLGKVEFCDGQEAIEVTATDISQIAYPFNRRGIDLVIDYESRPLQEEQAATAGWIKELRTLHDGLWARVVWTQQARDYLGKHRYYVNPGMMWRSSYRLKLNPSTRRPFALVAVSLTDNPVILGQEAIFAGTIRVPKPFGPGTRLRAKNGDKLVVISDMSGEMVATINLTTSHMVKTTKGCWLSSLTDLLQALEAAGAVVV